MIQIDLPMPEACDVCPLNYDFCWCKGFKDDEFDKWSDDWNDQVCEGERRPEYCPLKEPEEEMSRISNAYLELVGKASKQPKVVRCKDCKHIEISPSGLMKCNNVFRSPDWYCADGEAKE